MASPQHRRHWKALDAVAWVLVLGGLYWFAASFFLAKRSLSQLSTCDEACPLLKETLGLDPSLCRALQERGALASPVAPAASNNGTITQRMGCWMDRKVDSMAIVVVDALRFDFALYSLPKSIGPSLDHHLHQGHGTSGDSISYSSALMQFVADPPTVTMQRLKALTTGGLPTFADISANLGGASVDEDSWVRMLKEIPWMKRGLRIPAQAGFVGDDTWMDLYPNGFTDAFPYPSFNTRDLNTVDDGCEKHIPDLVQRLRKHGHPRPDELELMVVHFLGVDHVGHTYGPHNQYMDAKLRQMDTDLKFLMDRLDESDESCHAAIIFGDHGMTADGNHGGGTEEEIAAALFVHLSRGCPAPAMSYRTSSDKNDKADGTPSNPYPLQLEMQRKSELVDAVFGAVHQIDLVPTLSMLLGLPIPFANLGSIAPSLVPGFTAEQAATALALNAAQVWRYFTVYSEQANRLPGLRDLEQDLDMAVSVFQKAVKAAVSVDAQDESQAQDSDDYVQAAILFKSFLQNALELGQRVWTRFDGFGMTGGICVLGIGLILFALPLILELLRGMSKSLYIPVSHISEMVLAAIFMLFLCGLLTFSNSYILEEENSIMYCLAVLSMALALRIRGTTSIAANTSGSSGETILSSLTTPWKMVLVIPILSRLGELLVSGHGMDPSIRLHAAHHSVVFLTSLWLLSVFRWLVYKTQIVDSQSHFLADLSSLFFLALSWWEKRSPDVERTGYTYSRIVMALLGLGMASAVTRSFGGPKTTEKASSSQVLLQGGDKQVLTILIKVMIAIMTVTGPAAATSFVIYTIQVVIVYLLSASAHFPKFASIRPSSMIVACLLKLITRHGECGVVDIAS